MALSKSDFEKLDSRLKNIIEQSVEQIEVSSDLPPTIEQLEDNNRTYSIVAAILFIDIRKSTYLTENSQAKSMVKIYRSFMRMAVECVRKNSGVTRQFLGDRIMGVFIDSVDERGNIAEKAVDKAISAARSFQTVIDFSLNKYLKSKVNGKIIECGIGIDYGKVLVTQVGMYGVEQDENKENEVNCVWVGNTTNHASKYSDLASGGEIFISENVYRQMSDESKDVFIKLAKYKGTKLFQGYVTKDFYLDYSEELGKPTKTENDSLVEINTSQQLAEGIKEIERLQNNLIRREKEITVLEEKLKKENDDIKKRYLNENNLKIKAVEEKEKADELLEQEISSSYSFIHDLIKGSFCREYEYIKNIGIKRWKRIDELYHELGKKQGYDEDTINESSFYFIGIYAYFEYYNLSYKYMVSMAKKSDTWVYINESTFKWACEQNQGWKAIDAMEDNLQNNRIKYKHIKDYEENINKLKKLRGF